MAITTTASVVNVTPNTTAALLSCWMEGFWFGVLNGEPPPTPSSDGEVVGVSWLDVAPGWVLCGDAPMGNTLVGCGLVVDCKDVDAAGGVDVCEGTGTTVEKLMEVFSVGLGAGGGLVDVGKVRSPTSKSPGVNGCVCKILRSESRQRICMAGATVTWAPAAVAVAKPQTPPLKSVMSVVHV